jgi:hypothetical protein
VAVGEGVGDPLAVGVGVGVCDAVAFEAVGDGELECVRVGRMLRTGSAGALVEECWGFAALT